MEQKPIVLVDMDGVLAGFHQRIVSIIEEQHPHIDISPAYSSFYIANAFPEYEEIIRLMSDEPGFFENLPLIDGAQEGWQGLEEAGFYPRICSAPLHTNEYSVEEKRNWLRRYFGNRVADEAIIKPDKTPHKGIALIDDKPNIKGQHTPAWKQIVFTYDYNRHLDTPYRIDGWRDERLLQHLREIGGLALR